MTSLDYLGEFQSNDRSGRLWMDPCRETPA